MHQARLAARRHDRELRAASFLPARSAVDCLLSRWTVSTSTDNEITQVNAVPLDDSPLAEADMAAPKTIGDLQLGERLALGFSGETYAAQNTVVARPCAIKLLHRDLDASPAALGRLSHQARQADLLQVESIVPYFGSGTGPDGRRFTIHGWAPGHSLREILAQHGALSRRVYMPIVDRLCRALAAAHSAGMVHGAIHAGNVMVEFSRERPPAVHLLDFGVHAIHPPVGEAPPAGLERKAEMAAFVSPEEAKGKAPDPRSDVYALSVLFYQMVTGKLPLLGSSYEETLEKQINETPPHPSEIASLPDDIAALVMQGLEKDPRKRTPSVEALLSGLDPVAAATGRHEALSRVATRERGLRLDTSEVPPVGKASISAPTLRPAGGKRRLWIFVGLGTALLLFGGVLTWSLLGSDDKGLGVRKKRGKPRVYRRQPRPIKRPRRARKSAPSQKKAARAGRAHPLGKAGPAKEHKVDRRRPLKGRQLRPDTVRRSLRRPNRLARQIRAFKGTGTLRVLTANPRARILLDGKFVGQGKLRTLRRIPPGKHRLELEIDGRRGAPREVEVKPGEVLDVTL